MNIFKNKGCTRVLMIIASILLIVSNSASAQQNIFIADGLCDVRGVDFSSQSIALSGHWNFFPNELLTPAEVRIKTVSPDVIVPSLWNDNGFSIDGTGFGTYRLKILLPKNDLEWALEIPQLYNSYFLFINDSLYAHNGTPGVTATETKLQWKPQTVSFVSTSDTTEIILQLSNFHHFKGGIREHIHLGSKINVNSHFKNAITSTLIEVVLVTLLALGFLFIYVINAKEEITLYFALLCMSWAVRELFSDLYPINRFFPEINWFLLVRTEYITLFLIIIFGILFINKLFADLSSEVFKYLMIIVNIIFILFTIFTPVAAFTRWLPMYLIAAVIALLYSAVIIVRALIFEKTGAWFLISGLILTIITIGYDLIAYKGILANNILIGSIMYCIIYILCAIGLLQYLKIIKSGDSSGGTLTYKDLYR